MPAQGGLRTPILLFLVLTVALPAPTHTFAPPPPSLLRSAKMYRQRSQPLPGRPMASVLPKRPESSASSASSNSESPTPQPPPPMSDKEKIIAGAMAFAAVAGSGIAAFAVEQGGTVAVVELLRRLTGTTGVAQAFDAITFQAAQMGWSAVVPAAAVCTVLQIAPVCNGILMAMGMGLIFGTVKGVGVMSVSAVTSSVVCLLTGRMLGKSVLAGGLNSAPPVFKAVAEGFGDGETRAAILVALVRLSPVIPFVWSNYLFGLTSVPVLPYIVGTTIGTLPGLTVFVSAGVLGKGVFSGTIQVPPALLATGVVATISVLVILSKISQAELAKISKNDQTPP